MAKSVTFHNMYDDGSKFDAAVVYERVSGVNITDQEFIWDIPGLLAMYQNDMTKIREKFNNHLLFESSLGGVFIDELNEKEVSEFKQAKAEFDRKQAEAEKEKLLFEEYKASIALKLKEQSAYSAAPAAPANDSSSSN